MVQKMPSSFLRRLQLMGVLLLICDSYMNWSTGFVSLKLCVGFSIFDSVSFLLKFRKCMKFWTLKRHNSFQNENNIKLAHSFASRFLIFKLEQEVLKFNDICMSWSSPQTELLTNFLKPQNQSFENVSIVGS